MEWDKNHEYSSWFQCIAGCPGRHPLNEIIYVCPGCGELLEVVHDLEALKKKSGSYWKELFDRRYRRPDFPYGSSVWGKKEMVCPNVDNANIISMYEGGTNLFHAHRFAHAIGMSDLWIKQSGTNATGSFKDLGMTVLVSMVNQMIAEGQDILGVACASTGDTSASLAAYCAAADLRAIVFLPRGKVSTAQLIQPLASGALTLALDTDFDGCMELVRNICRKNNIYLANSMNSLRVEGQKTVGMEIVQQLDWEVPDTIIIPGGNLGNVSALGKGLILMRDLGMIDRFPRIVCAQAEKANPLYLSYKTGFKEYHPVTAGNTVASAIRIGNPVSIKKAVKVLEKFDGIVEQATEDELANAAAWADKTGLFCCPHTGVALAVLLKLLDAGTIGRREKVVVISTANGLKFTEFKTKYHEGKLEEVEARFSNLPVDLPAEYEAVRKVIYEKT